MRDKIFYFNVYNTQHKQLKKNLNNWKLRPYKSKIGIKRKWRRGLSNKCRSTSKEPRSSKREQKQYGSERDSERKREKTDARYGEFYFTLFRKARIPIYSS